jgi:hypothetical protein
MRYVLCKLGLTAALSISLFVSMGTTASAQGGQNYCVTSPNSAGPGALIRWSGPVNVRMGRLVVDGLPRNSSGIFLYGYGEQQTPFGNGFSCIGGPTGLLARKRASFGSVTLDFNGESDVLALRAILQNVNIPVRFQYMYRDPHDGGARFNLSNGLRMWLGGAGT